MFSASAGKGGALTSAFAANRGSAVAAQASTPQVAVGGFGSFLDKANKLKLSSGKTIKVTPDGYQPEKSRTPTNFASYTATELVRSIRQLLSPSASGTANLPPFESLYANTEAQVSINNAAEDLYDRIKMEIEKAAGEMAKSLRSAGASKNRTESDISWLSQLEQAWIGWLDRISLVQSILLPLDRDLVSRNSDQMTVWDLAMDIFGHRILRDSDIAETALSCIVSAVNADREGTVQYRQLHSTLLAMFLKLSAYHALEAALRDATSAFYQVEAQKSLETMAISDYLFYADERIVQETERSDWMLSEAKGKRENMKAARTELVAKHTDKILTGLSDLISSERFEDLGKMYALLKSVDALPKLRDEFAAYIKKAGESIVNDKEKDDEMIDRLLAYKAKIDHIVTDSFGKNGAFANAQKDSFEVFVNKRENKPAELIAKFLDAKLKSGNKTMTDEELEFCMNEALILFRYTHDKDMFEEFYKRYFAKRLLLNRSASSDAEKSMLLKLKEECGPGFTAKLETMIKDVELSKDLMQEYQQARAKDGAQPDPFDLSVSVLTQAHWPTYPQVDVILPADMASIAENFVAFYQNRNGGRKLHWQHSLGTLSVTADFPKAGTKELNVSTFQAIVLMLFNSLQPGDKLSYKDIRTQTGLEDKELKRTLQSLACGQIPTRVLRKLPQGKDIEDDDEFIFNETFKTERHRIRINQIQMKETAEEQKSTEQRVFLDRELILQAAAVRVLKARKTIKHSELITEVVDQIKSRFAVDVPEIKKTFEILIDKEYMERVEGERTTYRYLA